MNYITIEALYQVYKANPNFSKDTRNIEKGCIYLALKGESFDGNKFADEAIAKGASYAIIDNQSYKKDDRYLLVEDVLTTLQELANYHRKQLSIPILAISGSNGKTTTKELIATALSTKYNVLHTNGNYNNHIGVPLTLLRIKPEHEIAIIEMGANHQGEIDFLCQIAEPNFAMLTNIGKAHLEGFGGEEGVRKGKTEMFRFIEKNGGKLFINLDDEKIKTSVPAKVETITYSLSSEADCKGDLIKTHPRLKGKWYFDKNAGELNSSLYGAYNFHNILAACTIATYFDVPANDITKAINRYDSDMNRSQLLEKDGMKIYLDAYNANPSSLSLSLDNFEKAEANSKIAILGDMFELGEAAFQEHKKIVEQANMAKSLDKVVLVGHHFFEHQLAKEKFTFFKTTEEAKVWFKAQNFQGHTLLLKGSRGMKLESLLES